MGVCEMDSGSYFNDYLQSMSIANKALVTK